MDWYARKWQNHEQAGEKTRVFWCVPLGNQIRCTSNHNTDRYQTCSIEFSCFLAKCMIFSNWEQLLGVVNPFEQKNKTNRLGNSIKCP